MLKRTNGEVVAARHIHGVDRAPHAVRIEPPAERRLGHSHHSVGEEAASEDRHDRGAEIPGHHRGPEQDVATREPSPRSWTVARWGRDHEGEV